MRKKITRINHVANSFYTIVIYSTPRQSQVLLANCLLGGPDQFDLPAASTVILKLSAEEHRRHSPYVPQQDLPELLHIYLQLHLMVQPLMLEMTFF